jgi:hypothetical protein
MLPHSKRLPACFAVTGGVEEGERLGKNKLLFQASVGIGCSNQIGLTDAEAREKEHKQQVRTAYTCGR